ncbi:SRPBCC domain-containing protein [Paenibacillus athensensis]|uniref:Polyketide cyclase n=1 Tax=Paenibacillus athensensis TaxID=1967502 RepID=A0A4Y8PTL7_9BACL|nr:SRPBCC domain-containing protein [Paenibacillus athensensis]MCD1258583.1 SRPBCC domain-containing protein [Paenibacillus athensensis]
MSNPAELIITRTFDAPRELVFRVCTEAEHLKMWWGPKGWDMHVAKLELTPGGMFLYSQSANGQTMWGKFVYREIAAPEKLVFTNSFSDAEGNTVRAPFSATWPLEILNTWSLEEQDGRTIVTMHGTPLDATEEELQTFDSAKDMLQQGFKGTFSQLEEYLATLV